MAEYTTLGGGGGLSASSCLAAPQVYKTFDFFFVPLMHHTYSCVPGGGHLDDTWSMGVEINIPKGNFTDSHHRNTNHDNCQRHVEMDLHNLSAGARGCIWTTNPSPTG